MSQVLLQLVVAFHFRALKDEWLTDRSEHSRYFCYAKRCVKIELNAYVHTDDKDINFPI